MHNVRECDRLLSQFIVLLSGFLFSGYAFGNILPPASQTISYHEDIVVLAVHQAIKDNQLSALRDQCLAYDYDEVSDKNYFLVDVRENRRYAICGGDPDASIHLFRFKVDRKDYSLMTDAGSTDGRFHSIKQ